MDYNILGLYTHGKKDFNLTFNQFFRSCLKDDALFDALKLKEEWPSIPTILAVNEVETIFMLKLKYTLKLNDKPYCIKQNACIVLFKLNAKMKRNKNHFLSSTKNDFGACQSTKVMKFTSAHVFRH